MPQHDNPLQTPLQALLRHATERPDAIALVGEGDAWTYRQLADEALRLAHGLHRAGVVPGDRIAMIVRPSLAYSAFLFAAMMTGSIAVPLKVELTPNELNGFLERLRPVFFVHDPDLKDVVDRMDPAVVARTRVRSSGNDGDTSWRHLLANAVGIHDLPSDDIDAVCLLIATSGTTGIPKLVAYSQRVIAYALDGLEGWDVDQDSCIIGSTPVAHISGTMAMLFSVSKGAKEVLLSQFNPDKVLDLIERHQGSAMFVAPLIAQALVAAQQKQARNISSLRVCGIGGDACRAHIAEAFEETFGMRLSNTYGMTECLGSVTGGDHWSTLRAIEGRARLVDAQGKVLTAGSTGELQMRGPNLSLGYWKGPGDIASHTTDGWLATGDLMTLDHDGQLHFVGRSKDQIVRNTDKISPVEVENQLIQHDSVADAAVAGAPDGDAGEKVLAIVRLADDADPDAILAWLRTRLAPFKVPEKIVAVDTIPRNALGKIERRLVADMALSAEPTGSVVTHVA